MFCPHCGAKLNTGARFCAQCGQAIATQMPESAQETAPSPVPTETIPAMPANGQPTTPSEPALPPTSEVPNSAAQTQSVPQINVPDAATTPITPIAADTASTAATTPIPVTPTQPQQPTGQQFGGSQPTLQTPQQTPQQPTAQTPQQPTQQTPPQPTPQTPQQAPQQPTAQATFNAATQQIANNPLIKQLTAPAILKTAGISLGIGLASALVMAVLGSFIFIFAYSSLMQDVGYMPLLSAAASYGDISTSTPNYLQMLVMVLVMGVSGSFSVKLSAVGYTLNSMGFKTYLWMPFNLSGLALLIGAAAGAYWFARKNAVHFKWVGAISAAAVGVASGLIYILLAALIPLSASAAVSSYGATAAITGVSLRTFVMALLTAGLGSLAGYALAQYAPDANNVFVAVWQWAHRTRGFVRTLIDAFAVYSVVFTVLGLIAVIAGAVITQQWQYILLIPLLFPILPLALFVIGSFGGITIAITTQGTQQGMTVSVFGVDYGYGYSNYGSSYNSGSMSWILWVLFAIFLISTLYIALRASARNLYDPAFMNWTHAWKAPVATIVLWLIAEYTVANFSAGASVPDSVASLLSMTGGANVASATASPTMWYFIVAGAWIFLIEVVAMTFGRSLVLSLPGLWRCFVGGTVQPTPQPVADYVFACGALFGAYPTAVAAMTAVHSTSTTDTASHPTSPTGAAPSNTDVPFASQVPVNPAVPNMGATNADNGNSPSAFGAPTSSATGGLNAPAAAAPFVTPAATSTPSAPSSPNSTTSATGPTFPGMPVAPAANAAPQTPQMPQVPQAKAVSMSASQKRIAIIITVIVGIAAALGIAYAVLNATVFSPNAVAKSYISAIADGDYDKASSIANPQVDQTHGVLLTNAAAKGENATIMNQRITNTTKNGDGSQVISFSYTLNGQEQSDAVVVAPSGSKFLIFKNWAITTPLVRQISVNVPTSVSEVTVNGVLVSSKNSVSGSDTSFTFQVYPGSYTIETPKSKYISSQAVRVNTTDSTAGQIEITPTAALTTAIEDTIKSQVDQCATSTSANPGEGCPFSFYTYSDDDFRNFAWSITKYPEVSDVDPNYGSFSASEGDVKVTYEYHSYDGSWSPENDSTSFYVYGTFSINGDKVTVDLQSY